MRTNLTQYRLGAMAAGLLIVLCAALPLAADTVLITGANSGIGLEFTKEYQVPALEGTFTMGQYLSLLPTLLGWYGVVWSLKRRVPAGWAPDARRRWPEPMSPPPPGIARNRRRSARRRRGQ